MVILKSYSGVDMARIKRKNCITCENKRVELWSHQDEYLPHISGMSVEIFCDIKHKYPKRGQDCPAWIQESEQTKAHYKACKVKCDRHNAKEDWEHEIDFYGLDDLPGYR